MRRAPGPARFVATCLLSVFAVLLGGCALLRRGDPPVDRSQDPRIAREVEARIVAEPALDASRIRVDVDGAIVLLYGSVDGIGAWNCALRTAQLVPGVRSVVDYLVIERGPRDAPCLAPRDPVAPAVPLRDEVAS